MYSVGFLLVLFAVPFNVFSQNDFSLPSIQFGGDEINIAKDQLEVLQSAASLIKQEPEWKVRVSGHSAPNKAGQQRGWDRVNAVIRYLIEKTGISEKRFIFSYNEEGDYNVVDLIPTHENGPDNVPSPHPNLSRTNTDLIKSVNHKPVTGKRVH